ncbi:VOC family protein [Mycolicibacterium confluentis]|uniref:Glyoxalase n=1 Tax=Mycolicibacterium confluentis TaxID=28047 RepID=A0A7I7XTQ4_9MYCO|nr:VOC family protein [Mycolicibacterium confluentis]MCV7319433.1 VOC family protein [Mycolicibacterium confluentis]ORV24394.1 extradiol dioxygenase [Mycolicibacterium confluentis]BBZ32514.1 glyoxalase [Mycolicibacterium confluentis]
MSVSHIGLRVRDLDTSKLFYEALGFTEVNRLTVPDKIAEGLLGLASPIGFEAIYLRKDAFVLQLLTFSGHPAPEEAERGMVNGGLTHLSLAVDDVEAAKAAVRSSGGTVTAEPPGGYACMVRDPEGQLIELIHSSVRPVQN